MPRPSDENKQSRKGPICLKHQIKRKKSHERPMWLEYQIKKYEKEGEKYIRCA